MIVSSLSKPLGLYDYGGLNPAGKSNPLKLLPFQCPHPIMKETLGEIRSRTNNLMEIAITTPKLRKSSVQQRETFLPANEIFNSEGPPRQHLMWMSTKT